MIYFAPYLHRPAKILAQFSKILVKFGWNPKSSPKRKANGDFVKFGMLGLRSLFFNARELKFAKKLDLCRWKKRKQKIKFHRRSKRLKRDLNFTDKEVEIRNEELNLIRFSGRLNLTPPRLHHFAAFVLVLGVGYRNILLAFSRCIHSLSTFEKKLDAFVVRKHYAACGSCAFEIMLFTFFVG